MTRPLYLVITLTALFIAFMVMDTASAQQISEADACRGQLAELSSNLQGAPMGAIGRPGQPPVKLNNGKWYSISEIDSIRQELHRATRLCQDGKTHDGLNELNRVRRHFDLAALPHPESHGPQ